MEVKCKCANPDCRNTVVISMSQSEQETEYLRTALLNGTLCELCSIKEEKFFTQKEHDLRETKKLLEAEQSYKIRLKKSMLEHYHLSYDPQHPGANQRLFDWMEKCKDGSVVIPDSSGECKSRILMHYAYKKLREGLSVLYFPCPDLLDKIGTAFRTETKGEMFFDWIMSFELLIIDEILRDAGSAKGIQRLWQIIDRRYTMTDQKNNIQSGKWSPMYIKGKDRRHGWQLWIAGNGSSQEIEHRFSIGQKAGGRAVTRRLNEIGKIWPNAGSG